MVHQLTPMTGRPEQPGGADVLAALIQDARHGDREAFSSLIRIHRPTVQRVALRLVGNHEDAEDIAQEAFVRAWSGLEGLREGERSAERFSAWLLRIAVHLSRDLQRRRGRRPEQAAAELLATPGAEKALEPAAADHLGPSRLGAQREIERRVSIAIAALPERLRVAFVLRALEGLPFDAIGDITGVRPATVRTQMVQARRALRRMLGDLIEEDRP